MPKTPVTASRAAEQSHDAKRSRCGTRREEHEIECVGPSVDGEGQAGVSAREHAG